MIYNVNNNISWNQKYCASIYGRQKTTVTYISKKKLKYNQFKSYAYHKVMAYEDIQEYNGSVKQSMWTNERLSKSIRNFKSVRKLNFLWLFALFQAMALRGLNN